MKKILLPFLFILIAASCKKDKDSEYFYVHHQTTFGTSVDQTSIKIVAHQAIMGDLGKTLEIKSNDNSPVILAYVANGEKDYSVNITSQKSATSFKVIFTNNSGNRVLSNITKSEKQTAVYADSGS